METLAAFGTIVGESKPLRDMFALIEKSAKVDVPVLIEGETGTGKDLVAHEVHRRSARAGNRFVAVNTGALNREMIESELFGYVRGAFTGANDARPGRFEEADGGTLFLDEISTMEEKTQVALLRVLEAKAFRPLGAKKDVHVDVRLIAATNGNLDDEVEQGAFREDLLHRLRVFRIATPPLRHIRDDIPALCEHFIDEIREEFDLAVHGITVEALQLLQDYDWPGNTRELKNVVAQSAVIADAAMIDVPHLPARFRSESVPGGSPVPGSVGAGASSPSTPEPEIAETHEGVFVPFGLSLSQVEESYVRKTLARLGGNKTRAAKSLGISRKTLYDRLKRWDSTA